MTTLREAALMALIAMEEAVEYAKYIRAEHYMRPYAIENLRKALEQQAKHAETYDSLERYTQEIRTILSGAAKRKPLTDEEIDKVTDAQWSRNNHKPIYAAHRAYARAIERAHGIGEKE